MPKRYLTLDGMRGVAALAVVFYHATGFLNPQFPDSRTLRFGYLAVDMFFALSGFVIAHSYSDKLKNGMARKEFLLRRLIRLYPLYVLAFAIGSVPTLLNFGHGGSRLVDLERLIPGFLALPSPTWNYGPAIIPLLFPAWSLFAEFYVANLLFILLWKKLSNRFLLVSALLALLALVLASLRYGTMNIGNLWSDVVGLPARVLFSFIMGIVIQRVHRVWKPPAVPGIIILIITAVTFAPRLEGLTSQLYEMACVVLVYPALLYLGAHAADRRAGVGVLLGDASYALYLVHVPVLIIVTAHMSQLHLHYGLSLYLGFVAAIFVVACGLARVDTLVRTALTSRLLIRSPGGVAQTRPSSAS